MRRALAAAGLLAGCANVAPPPGGPVDQDPPRLVATRPDSLARVPSWRGPVAFVFDEPLSERGFDNAGRERVVVSPDVAPVRAGVSGRQVRVELRGGWPAGVVFTVTLLPGVADLAGNLTRDAVPLTFSTGPEIPPGGLEVQARTAEEDRPPARGWVRAFPPAGASYLARLDTAGRARLPHLPPGRYRVVAFDDVDGDRQPDASETQGEDTVTVAAAPVQRALRLLPPDTTPPVVRAARLQGDTLVLEFDDPLDPAAPPPQVTVRDSTGRAVPVRGVAPLARPSRTLRVPLGGPVAPPLEVRVDGATNLRGLRGGGTRRVPSSSTRSGS